jgi:hypothetical protein
MQFKTHMFFKREKKKFLNCILSEKFVVLIENTYERNLNNFLNRFEV